MTQNRSQKRKNDDTENTSYEIRDPTKHLEHRRKWTVVPHQK